LGFRAEPRALDTKEKYSIQKNANAIVGPSAYTKAVSKITKMPLYIVNWPMQEYSGRQECAEETPSDL
jgi:hypothetical protein